MLFLSLRKCAEYWGIRFGFGGVRGKHFDAGMRGSFGVVPLLGKPGEKPKLCKASAGEPEGRRQESVWFPLGYPGSHGEGRRDSPGVAWVCPVAHGEIG